MKKTLYFIVFGILATTTTILCSKKEDKCASCETLPDITNSVVFTNSSVRTISSSTLSVNLAFWKIEDRQASNYYYGTYDKAKTNDFVTIKTVIENIIGATEIKWADLYATTVYYKSASQITNAIDVNNINGFSFYVNNNSRLFHYLYYKKDGVYVNISELNTQIQGINIARINDIALNFFYDATRVNYSICLGLTSADNRISTFNTGKDYLTDNLKYYLKNNRAIVTSPNSLFKVVDGKCPAPCSEKSVNKFCEASFPSSQVSCKPRGGLLGDVCIAIRAQEISDSVNANGPKPEKSNLYVLRDSVLQNSTLGTQFTNDYYYLSNKLGKNMNPQLALDMIDYLSRVGSNKVNNFLYGNIRQTLFSTAEVLELKGYISRFRTVDSNDIQLQNMLNFWDNKLSQYQNKSINEIKLDF